MPYCCFFLLRESIVAIAGWTYKD